MARRKSREKDPVTSAARVVTLPLRLKSRISAAIRPAARVVGAIGFAMCAGVAVLAGTPDAEWPASLVPSRLPVYAMISLATASLLGWTFVEDGQQRIERRIGRPASLLVFLVVPIVLAVAGFIGRDDLAAIGGPGPAHWFWGVVRWYGPALVALSIVSFLTWKSRGRSGRGFLFAVLVAPYAALFAYLVIGVHLPGIDEAHRRTVESLGGSAIALQLALAFFVGGD